MRTEDSLLFACTRQQFDDSQRAAVQALAYSRTDWESVWEVARNHGVAPIVYRNLKSANIPTLPQAIDAKFKQYLFQNITRRQRSEQQLLRALRFLAGQDVAVMLVKGAALNKRVYDESWYTFSEDIDLLLRPSRQELANTAGTKILDFLDEINIQRSSLQENIEYDFYAHHDVTMNDLLNVDFQAVWQEARRIPVGDQLAYCMADADLMIAACIGSARKRFFRLKSLLDIAESTRKLPALNWSQIAAKADTYNCSAIVYTAVRIADLTLGCSLPPGSLAMLKLSKSRRWLIDLLARGLIERSTLPGLSPYRGQQIGGRVFNPALLLSCVALQPRQLANYLGRLPAAAAD